MNRRESRREALLEQEPVGLSTCRHHWVIDSPSGPVSKGICRLCGEERGFKNFLEGSSWDDFTLEQVSTGGRIPVGIMLGARNEDEEGA